jgi:hypothetical protein
MGRSEGGCLGARPEVELGQDAADVMGDCLAADEELRGDLRIGETTSRPIS